MSNVPVSEPVAPPAVSSKFWAFIDKHAFKIVLALAVFCFFFRLGSVGICDGSESYYPSAAREMVEANNYLVPQLNYQILFAKPIMIFWLIIAGYKLFGLTSFAARFFAAVFALGLTALTYHSARTVSNARAGLLASLIVMASPLIIDYARLSEIDLFFSSFLGLSYLSTMLVISGGRTKFWPLIYVGLGAALLTKGPASLVIYGVGYVLGMILLRCDLKGWKTALSAIKPWFGIPLMLAIALPWWIAVWKATDGSFPTYFIAYENFGRAAGLTNTNPRYWFRYPAVILLGLFPWSLFLPAFLWRTVKSVLGKVPRLADVNGETRDRSGEAPDSAAAVASSLLDGKRVALGFGAAVIIIFGLSKTQMEPYLLPAVAPLAVYMALSFNDWLSAAGDDFVARWTRIASGIILVVGVLMAIGGFALPMVFKLSLANPTWPLFALPLAGLLLGGAMIAQFFILRRGEMQRGLLTMSLIMAMGTTLGVEAGIEAWYGNTIKDLHYLCTLLDNKPGQVGFFLDCRSSVLFYVKRPVYFFFQPERLVPYADYKFKLSDEALKFPLYVFSERKHLPALTAQKGMTISTVGESGKWGLYEVKGARLEPYETLIKTFEKVPLHDLATKNLPTGPLTLPFGGGTFVHNQLDPHQYR
ncbi:MAG: glycosyltransferase family 39 protein [Cyanobacteria bacterium SZAS TMP-1]|nr:glycosyltransferase family 39 protein [Cyanobacteria bacterium SZAS TMP-1]